MDDHHVADGPEWRRDPYLISTDRRKIDLDGVHGFLTTSYWSPGIPRAVVRRAIDDSLPVGLYHDADQIGRARVVTDYATVADLCAVFIRPGSRGAGRGTGLMAVVATYPPRQGLRRWVLVTRDAHGLYRPRRFTARAHPDRFMETVVPDAYAGGSRSEQTGG